MPAAVTNNRALAARAVLDPPRRHGALGLTPRGFVGGRPGVLSPQSPDNVLSFGVTCAIQI